MSERGLYRDGLVTLSALPESVLTQDRSLSESLSVVRDNGFSRLARVRSMLNIAGHVVPGLETRLTKLLAPNHLPIQTAELANCGGVHTVFTDEERTHALKIDRFSLGMSHEEMVRHTLEKQEKYDIIRKTIDEPDMVVPTSFLIVHSHVLNKPVSAMVQPYLPNLRDIFFDFTPEELAAQMRTNETLRKQFDTFNRVRDNIEHDGETWSLDYLGKGNITVTEQGTMAIVDPDILPESYLQAQPGRMRLIQKRRDFLTEVEQKLEY